MMNEYQKELQKIRLHNMDDSIVMTLLDDGMNPESFSDIIKYTDDNIPSEIALRDRIDELENTLDYIRRMDRV
jgi:hypothetical protein